MALFLEFLEDGCWILILATRLFIETEEVETTKFVEFDIQITYVN